MNFLRGGMKPETDGIAAPVSTGATGAAAAVASGFTFEAPAAGVLAEPAVAAPADCAAACDDAVEAFFVATLSCEEAEAEEPGATLAFDAAALSVGVAVLAAPFCVGATLADDAEPAGADLAAFSVSVGDDAAAAAAGFVSVAGFAAVAAVPETEGAVAVAVAAFTAC